MNDQALAFDGETVRAVIIHRLRAYSETLADGTQDFMDSAAVSTVYPVLRRAQTARVTPEMSFGAGVEFGVALAIAAINSPLKRTEDFARAVDKASNELEAITATALEDLASKASLVVSNIAEWSEIGARHAATLHTDLSDFEDGGPKLASEAITPLFADIFDGEKAAHPDDVPWEIFSNAFELGFRVGVVTTTTPDEAISGIATLVDEGRAELRKSLRVAEGVPA